MTTCHSTPASRGPGRPLAAAQPGRAPYRLAAIALLLSLGACHHSSSSPPPNPRITLIQTSPAADAVLTAQPADIRATFDGDLPAVPVTHTWMSVTVDGATIPGATELAAGGRRTLVFTPATALPLDIPIRVDVTVPATDYEGSYALAPIGWTFTIRSATPTQIQAGPVTILQQNLLETRFLSMLRTAPDELALAFRSRTNFQYFDLAGFWSESSDSWSGFGSAPILDAQDSKVVPDGAGGLLIQRPYECVHFERSLASAASVDYAAYGTPVRMSGGQTIRWPLAATAGLSPSSYRWDNAAHAWVPTMATATYSFSQYPQTNEDLLLPYDDQSIQLVSWQAVPGNRQQLELVVIAITQTGAEITRTSLGVHVLGTSCAVAHTPDNHGMLAILEPTANGCDASVAEYRPGTGWGTAALVRSGTNPIALPSLTIADDGSAVLAFQTVTGLAVSARVATGAWVDAPLIHDFNPSASLVAAAVTSGGNVLVAATSGLGSDVQLVGKRGTQPWAAPVSSRTLGLVPASYSVRALLGATANRQFLMVSSYLDNVGLTTLNSAVLTLQ